ncbi:uncharacterized protein CLUP02_00838 [Colletotrichum lupini]|uniref:Uncharacterized protein n=1 Tax=Colletotrichum lupini TaxID=145971 RepID=A0A9Q8SBK2_9PEZI|nr:uncharacterized protein CLUP02_00838 [Colletotrichum lupini]UQC74190.1 hypothetical protein CLUP02_00838 [Colletotrichum lupini]
MTTLRLSACSRACLTLPPHLIVPAGPSLFVPCLPTQTLCSLTRTSSSKPVSSRVSVPAAASGGKTNRNGPQGLYLDLPPGTRWKNRSCVPVHAPARSNNLPAEDSKPGDR